VYRTAARSTENQVAFCEQNVLAADRSPFRQLLYKSCTKSRRVLRDIAERETVSYNKKTRKIDSYSLRPISRSTTNGTRRIRHTPKRIGSRFMPIASLVLASLLTTATSPSRRLLYSSDCPYSICDEISA
jgi:hypothetical protein